MASFVKATLPPSLKIFWSHNCSAGYSCLPNLSFLQPPIPEIQAQRNI